MAAGFAPFAASLEIKNVPVSREGAKTRSPDEAKTIPADPSPTCGSILASWRLAGGPGTSSLLAILCAFAACRRGDPRGRSLAHPELGEQYLHILISKHINHGNICLQHSS